MAPIIDKPRPEPADAFKSLAPLPKSGDVPDLMAERVGYLYAEEERQSRRERTERMIRQAESLQ
jgi:hypothetical protein